MADYTDSAFYKVRRWLIQELSDNGIGEIQVVPIQQVPEVENQDTIGGGPGGWVPGDESFIVYDVLVPGGYDTQYWNCRDEVMLWIYDYDVERLFEIKEFMYDLFGRFDLSAADINSMEDDSPFLFHYFDIMMGLPTDQADQVLGRKGMNMVISYEYTRPRLANGRFA